MKIRHLLAAAFFAAVVSGCAGPPEERDLLFQTSTIGALFEGVYDGETTCGELKRYGDHGIGTFNRLNGEMVVVGGRIYRVEADGVARPAGQSDKTPFAEITFFEADREASIDRPLTYKGLREYLDGLLPSKNFLYAISIDGSFEYMKTRSVPGQKKPYPPLVEVVKSQPVFEFRDVKGTMVGFWMPEYMKGLNVPGYHFHFITEDRKAGGHVLECKLSDVLVGIDYTNRYYLVLPESAEFGEANLETDKRNEPGGVIE